MIGRVIELTSLYKGGLVWGLLSVGALLKGIDFGLYHATVDLGSLPLRIMSDQVLDMVQADGIHIQ